MSLTAFEQEVAAMTVRGKRGTEIAKATGRSYDAVVRARTHIRDKLGIESTDDLRLVLLLAENAELRQRIRELEGRRHER